MILQVAPAVAILRGWAPASELVFCRAAYRPRTLMLQTAGRARNHGRVPEPRLEERPVRPFDSADRERVPSEGRLGVTETAPSIGA